MRNFLYNFDNNEILYFITILDNEISNLDDKQNALQDLKDEFLKYLNDNKLED